MSEEMKFMRTKPTYTWQVDKANEVILLELKISPVVKKTKKY
jgi:hypothetical protein